MERIYKETQIDDDSFKGERTNIERNISSKILSGWSGNGFLINCDHGGVTPYVKLIADVLIAPVYTVASHNCNIVRCVPALHARNT